VGKKRIEADWCRPISEDPRARRLIQESHECGGFSHARIAEEMGVCGERVRQIERVAIGKLKRKIKPAKLAILREFLAR
jgi:DNA-directed RNA polymerase sigma subunit (sigma70/sigma32)